MKRLIVTTALLFFIFALTYLGIKRWYFADFPDLAPGVYVGSMTFYGSKRSVPWLVVRRPGESSLAVALGLVTVSAQRAAVKDPVSGVRQALFVTGADRRFRFTGTVVSEGIYSGGFDEPVADESGSWSLTRSAISELSLGNQNDLTRWYSLWQELERIESKIQEWRRKVDEQGAVIENLHRAVSEGETLKKTADSRLGRTDSELEAVESELVTRQERLDEKLRDFELTQRISQEGKLVYLSRESIRRDARWIDSKLEEVKGGT